MPAAVECCRHGVDETVHDIFYACGKNKRHAGDRPECRCLPKRGDESGNLSSCWRGELTVGDESHGGEQDGGWAMAGSETRGGERGGRRLVIKGGGCHIYWIILDNNIYNGVWEILSEGMAGGGSRGRSDRLSENMAGTHPILSPARRSFIIVQRFLRHPSYVNQ